MSFGNIIGGLIQQGMSSQGQNRLREGARNADPQGALDQLLGPLLGGAGPQPGGDLAGRARQFLRQDQIGGMSGAKVGGIGAIVGALSGGGLGGAARGGTMAILGTLAYQAWRAHQAGQSGATSTDVPQPSPDETQALTSPDTERLILRAMIGAAQADGKVSEAEMERIMGHLDGDEVTEAERAAVREEIARPVDVRALGAEVTRPEVATEVYLAAMLAVDIDSDAERNYFRQLAQALRLEQGVVERLHRMTGTPMV